MITKKIGFFGGCFNPPSNIHINLAKKVLIENKLDKVIFVPVGDFYKKAELALGRHRYNMLKILTDKEKNLGVDDFELNTNKLIYASEAFEIIEEKHKGNDVFFIMGEDNFEKMPKWKDYDNIINKYKYIILERAHKDVSSTQIRKMIKNKNHVVHKFLNKDVYNYIKENELYAWKAED